MLTITYQFIPTFGSQRDVCLIREKNRLSLGELEFYLLRVGSDGLISGHLESGYNLEGEILYSSSFLLILFGQDGNLVLLGNNGILKSGSHDIALGRSLLKFSELILSLAQFQGGISIGIAENLKVFLSLVEVCLETINLLSDGVDEFIELSRIGGKLVCQRHEGIVDGLGHSHSVLHFVSPTLYGLALTIKM